MLMFGIAILTEEEENICLWPPKYFNAVIQTSSFLKCFKFFFWPFIHNCRNLYIFSWSLCILIRKFYVKSFNTTCVNMKTTPALLRLLRVGAALSALSRFLDLTMHWMECRETLLWNSFRDVCKLLFAAETLLAFGLVCISQCLLHGIFKEQQLMEIYPVMFAFRCRMVN